MFRDHVLRDIRERFIAARADAMSDTALHLTFILDGLVALTLGNQLRMESLIEAGLCRAAFFRTQPFCFLGAGFAAIILPVAIGTVERLVILATVLNP